MSFSIDVLKFAKKTSSTADEAARAIKIALFNGIIRDTRVDTGRLRGNWQTTVGHPDYNTTERLDPVPQGADGGSAQSEVINTVRGDTVDYMTNNLPYAEVYEEIDAMVAKNMVRIERNIKEAIQ